MSDVQEYLKLGLQAYNEKDFDEFNKNVDLAFEADPENPEACFFKRRSELLVSESSNLLSNFASFIKCFVPAIKSIMASENSQEEMIDRLTTVVVMYDGSYEIAENGIVDSLKADDGAIKYDDWKAFWYDSFNRIRDQVDNVLPKILDYKLDDTQAISALLLKRAIGYRHDYSCYVKLANKNDSWWVPEKVALIKKFYPDYEAPVFKPFPKNFITKWYAQEKNYTDFNNCDKYLGIGE